MKRSGEKIACLTAYDASFAGALDAANVDVVLVGDSLGMVVQGKATTLPVTIEQMLYHTQCVAAGLSHALLMVDMPFMSYATTATALDNAALLMKEGGAHILKLEGGAAQVDTVKKLTDCGIPVCAHLGLQPQSVHVMGGYKVQGRDAETADTLLNDALVLQQAGASAVVLECIPADLAKHVTETLDIPTIGIGAGRDCDGQVLVLYDVLGITRGKLPTFSKNFLSDATTIDAALQCYVDDVKNQVFPSDTQSFS